MTNEIFDNETTTKKPAPKKPRKPAANKPNLKDMSIYDKVLAFQQECPVIPFDKEVNLGKGRKYHYASLPQINRHILPIMGKFGMGYTHLVEEDRLCCKVFSNGEELSCCFLLGNVDVPQQLGGKLTYYRRYSLACLLGIVTDEDNDVRDLPRDRPKLNPKAYEAAQERIQKGEQGILQKCKANFDLTPEQEDVLLNLELEYNV